MLQPASGKRRLPKVEFYITNVCNLTCQRCNRYNNHDFRGWQKWSDYEQEYQRWAELVTFDKIVILGGEPLLNPTILDWIHGIRTLWSNTPIQILSNGTRLTHVRGLRDVLDEQIWLGISWHNINDLDVLRQDMLEFLGSSCRELTGEHSRYRADLAFVDDQGCEVAVWIQNQFTDIAVKSDWSLHNNDPQKAHDVCAFALYNCYHFIKGRFYKCGPVALLPELDQQIGLQISEQDRALLNSYQPLSTQDYEQRAEYFFRDLDQPIPQCKFCPTEFTLEKIWPVRKNSIGK